MVKSKLLVLILGAAWMNHAGAAEPLTAGQDETKEIGDTLQFALPITAFALTYLLDRWSSPSRLNLNADDFTHFNDSPRHDLALALGRSFIVTQGLKFTVNEPRPNGGAHSFPSGHTSLAFTGAEFIRKEYGWRWGLPAYLVASYVGWSRVDSKAHYTHDVLAGAAIGILANHDFGGFHTRHGDIGLAPTWISNSPTSDSAGQMQTRGALGLQFTFRF